MNVHVCESFSARVSYRTHPELPTYNALSYMIHECMYSMYECMHMYIPFRSNRGLGERRE